MCSYLDDFVARMAGQAGGAEGAAGAVGAEEVAGAAAPRPAARAQRVVGAHLEVLRLQQRPQPRRGDALGVGLGHLLHAWHICGY
jgi:hypothetical protein